MKSPIEEKAIQEITEHLHQISLKASYADHHLEKVHKTLEDDPRIAYEYMSMRTNFLNTLEYGIKEKTNTLASEIKHDLTIYSAGNMDVVNEYMKNKEFQSQALSAFKLRTEINQDLITLEETFEKHRFPIEQHGVQMMIHRAENDMYNVFEESDKFSAQVRQELTGLLRHEPFEKSQEDIERDRQALEEQKRKQIEIRKRNEIARQQREYDEKNGRNTESIDLKQLDNRTKLQKEMEGVTTPENPVENLEFALGDYHEELRDGISEYRERHVDEIEFNLKALGHDLKSNSYKEMKSKLLSGSYSKDEQEFRSQFYKDASRTGLTVNQDINEKTSTTEKQPKSNRSLLSIER
ncbi:hypothetical protein EVJ32_10755 [Exiguobacterium sp. SH5S4]|uniref:hypothetical protein n=1 Tax=Exiguobacterium sp. SH5S4 TaxID=2510961 RepID=UPI00103B8CF1|nr:hypothetical protein [Exiguobacterium sp. SH5S4]TCI25272.1 hypothetical protein EVJ32_10755 [Exiguobacterium sp. SH5S4]